MAEQLKRVEKFGGEQYDALIRDDRGRVQLFNRLVAAVDSQSAMSVELRSIASELRHEQVQARERMLTLEHRLSALHQLSRRHGPPGSSAWCAAPHSCWSCWICGELVISSPVTGVAAATLPLRKVGAIAHWVRSHR